MDSNEQEEMMSKVDDEMDAMTKAEVVVNE